MYKETRTSQGKIASMFTEAIYTGSPLPRGQKNIVEKDTRRVLNLPVTKQLVYYPDNRKDETIKIYKYRVQKCYPSYMSIRAELVSGDVVIIHQGYLAEMQKPSFIADMREMERNENLNSSNSTVNI